MHVTEQAFSKLPCLRHLPLPLLQCPPRTPGSTQQRFPIPKSQLRLFRQDSDGQPNVEVLLGNLSDSVQLLRAGPDFTGPHLNQMDIVSCDSGPGRTEGQDKGQARLLRRPAAKHWKQTQKTDPEILPSLTLVTWDTEGAPVSRRWAPAIKLVVL